MSIAKDVPHWRRLEVGPNLGTLVQLVLAALLWAWDLQLRGGGPNSPVELLLWGVYTTAGLAAAWDLAFSQAGAGLLRRSALKECVAVVDAPGYWSRMPAASFSPISLRKASFSSPSGIPSSR